MHDGLHLTEEDHTPEPIQSGGVIYLFFLFFPPLISFCIMLYASAFLSQEYNGTRKPKGLTFYSPHLLIKLSVQHDF